MMKLLVPQQWYGISDMELERQTADRISFQRLLGWPEQLPDYSTVWQLRERLASTRTDKLLWAELQRQLDAKGLRVRKGVAQRARERRVRVVWGFVRVFLGDMSGFFMRGLVAVWVFWVVLVEVGGIGCR
jgi:IS5 family transposase